MLDDSRPRPTGLVVIALLNAVQGLWLLALGTMFAGLGFISLFTLDPKAVGGYSVLYGILIAAVGVVHLAVAYGLYAFRSWAWVGGVLVSVASLLVSAGAYAFTGEAPTLVSLIVPIVVIAYLVRPSIRTSFAG
jgi:4-hydroxybenzoate polyprenyltransferase